MKISDIASETYLALLANRTRSGLTILGIVIGIGSVIAMISIGQGAQGSIESSIQSLGSNLIMVTPGMQRSPGYQVSGGRGSAVTLKLADAEAIQQNVSGAQAVAPELSGRYQVTAKGTNTNTSIVGITPDYATVRNVQTSEGTFITEQNVKSLSRVAVLGPTAQTDLFGENSSPIGQTIRIKKIDFKIIGITQAKGGTGFSNQDDMIFIPISTAQQFLAGNTSVSTISVQATDQKNMTDIQNQITSLLLERHNISDSTLADFSVLNQADIIASASSITNTLTLLLGAIAGISLIVGGIGIMNMMLTNVTERTREIGLRKSIGAKKTDISMQFLTEAAALTIIGGVIGIFIGWLASLGITQFGGIATKISPTSVFLAFGMAAGIGLLFGYYPARKASNLHPIDALRYE